MAKKFYGPSELDEGVPKEIVEKVINSNPKRLIGPQYPYEKKLDTDEYERQKAELQVELLKLQRWVGDTGQRIVMIFEGSGCRRQGWNDQTVHGAHESKTGACDCIDDSQRQGAGAVVFPALCQHSSHQGRNGALRPLLVQPRRG